ncbi:hypothetical protein PF007_g10359 [Phytophthora fragariae]|uniref:Protein kinase domain-containing protein n=1 Tax=Phytophthora fragariae TaxID=53985 RepID=A0A6A3SDM0_9STRA|nr:hypothetical protein PF007_g10359 [Phytophthora fragariae]KAE9234260.1 hypothetical protein PF004_g9434 [Phytophthora fragariae]
MKPSGTSLWEACCTSLEEAKHVFARRDWGRKDLIEGVVRAAAEGKLDILEWLCAEGEELGMSDLVNSQSEVLGVSPLYVAARRGHLQVIEWLVGHGARLNEKNEAGRTALHAAAEGGHEDVVALLLTCGADANCSDNSGWTALGYASVAGHIDVVKQLVAHGGGGTDNETKTATGKGGGRSEIANYSEYLIDPGDIQLESSLRDGVGGVWLGSPVEVKMVKHFFMDRVELSREANVHEWRGLWELRCQQRQQEVAETLSNLPEFLNGFESEHEREEALAYVQFEQDLHSKVHTVKDQRFGNIDTTEQLTGAHLAISYLRSTKIDSWFVPEYDIEFDSYDAYSDDINGSKHRGKWRRAQVLVRKLKLTATLRRNDQEVFKANIKIWHKLRHPHIVQVFGACHVNPPFFVCEYVSGEQLSDFLRMHPDEVWNKLYEAALGLQYLHDKQVVHGDLRCSNILVGGDGSAKLSDFGFSMLDPEVSASGKPELKSGDKPNLEWRAPEVLQGEKATFASDIYSFGMCILEVVSGQYPADSGDDVYELVKQMCQYSPSDRISVFNVVDWFEKRSGSCCGPQLYFGKSLDELDKIPGDGDDEAKREAAESGCSSLLCDLTANMSRSTTSSASDFGIPDAIMTSNTPSTTKTWFIDQKDITFSSSKAFGSGGFAKVYHGTWRQAPVVLRRVRIQNEKDLATFLNEVKIWHKLRHPHIVQLFGACHIGQPFFVCEYAAGGELSDYLRVNPDEVWNKLYEAALGLQYLHDKQVMHGDIKGNNILVGRDGSAKLSDFGFSTLESNDSATSAIGLVSGDNPKLGAIRWRSPEVLRGDKATLKSDIYSFGMCILEAVSGKRPWFGIDYDVSVRYHVKEQLLPQRPENCGEDVYELVKQMCRFHPSDRIPISDVVRKLEILQHKHAPQPCVAVDSREVHVDAMPLSWSNLGDVEVSLFPIKDILAEMSTICSSLTGVDLMDRDVCDRLDDVFKQLQSRHGTATKEVVQRFGQLLLLVHQRLKRTSTSASVQASRHTASRQRADITSSVHEDLDLFMDMAMLCRSAEVHKWRELLLLRQKQQQQEMLTKLENFPELLGDITSAEEREDVLAYLRFELRTHPSSYLPVAKGAKTNVMHDETGMVPQFSSSMKLPKWFIPEYEVQFDSFGEFGQGSFGAVYRGRWMGADVVVKSVELFDPSIDRETPSSSARLVFESEVGIWYSLHHPNIIQLFGACHIRTTFFVSEYAGGGQLDNYSREHPDEVWTKLHEAALGLRYLHSHSIVHGDLKGNNILIGNDRCAKLTDFGLSFMSDTSESNLRVMTTGAVRWMAPEVLRGEQATLASDIYSFGMCILEAQSGEVPWGRKLPDLAVKYQVVKNKQLPSRPHNVSDEAFTLVGRVCRHDPSKRLSAQELVTALKDLRNIRRLEYRTPQSCKVVTSQDFQESSNQA